MRKTREFCAVALWAAALCFLGVGIEDSSHDGHNAITLALALFLSNAALVPTGWAILDYVRRKHAHETGHDLVEVLDALDKRGRDPHVARLH